MKVHTRLIFDNNNEHGVIKQEIIHTIDHTLNCRVVNTTDFCFLVLISLCNILNVMVVNIRVTIAFGIHSIGDSITSEDDMILK